jgi:hypothetical protein
MFTKSNLKKFLISSFVLLFLFPINQSSALDTPYTIDGKCVSRLLTFSALTSRPENGFQVVPFTGYVNVYVLNGSSFSYATQDVSGKLLSSPNQKFYFDYRASTLIPGNYAGYDYAGNTNYLSIGTANIVQDISYTCLGGTGTVLGGNSLLKSYNVSVSTVVPGYTLPVTVTGTGFYKQGSAVTLSVPHILGYVFDKWSGTCNSMSFVSRNYLTATSYRYNITNLSNDCNITANYIKEEQFFAILYHRFTISTNGGGTVTVGGSTSGSTSGASTFVSVRDGDTVTYSVTPNSGYVFTGWTGDLAGQSESGTLFSVRDYTATANFVATDVSGSGYLTDNTALNTFSISPGGAGFLRHSIDGIQYNFSVPFSITGLVMSQNNNSPGGAYLVTPVPYSGFEFVSWSGDSNVATSTLNRLNTDNKLGDWSATTTRVFTANFVYTGVANDNGETSIAVDEPTFSVENDAVSQLFKYDSNVPAPRSPYTIDGKCVNRAFTFTGRRLVGDGFISSWFPRSLNHQYTLYTVEGSTLTENQNDNIITFKSTPSSIYFSYDIPTLIEGDYSSDNVQYIQGSTNEFVVSNFIKTEFHKYNCDVSSNSADVKDSFVFLPYGSPMLQGFAYSVTGNSNLFNTIGNVYNVDSSTRDSFLESNNFDYRTLNASYYSAIRCPDLSAISLSDDLGCMVWLNDNVLLGQDIFDNKKYLWVISSAPVKDFVHEQEETTIVSGVDFDTNRRLLVFNPDIQGKIGTGTTTEPYNLYLIDHAINLYATRINMQNCVSYESVLSYQYKIAKFVANWFPSLGHGCPLIVDSKKMYLNHLSFKDVTNPDFVFIYGFYTTSSEEDLSKMSANQIAVNYLGSPEIDVATATSTYRGGNSALPSDKILGNASNTPNPPPYSTKTYSAPKNFGVNSIDGYVEGYDSAIATMSAYIENEYSISKCFEYGYTTDLLQGFGCVISNSVMLLLSKLVVPSVNDLSALNTFISPATTSPTSLVTAIFAIPLRFRHYADLNWYPNASNTNYVSSNFVPNAGYYNFTATTTLEGYYSYTATSTVNGYWTYTATSTGNVYATTTFLSNGTFNSPVSQNISVLLVGGGGGGGSQTGGGGGAGEYEYNSSFAIASSSYSVVIGSGGASNTAGNSTTFSTLIALGGGRGGEYSVNGGTGASGGGGGGGASNTTGGTGTNGYNGGNGTAVDGSNRYATGGGGGAGGVGGNGVSGTNAGVGGVGISNSISGTSIMYSCGGGGSWDTTGASGGCSSAGSGASTGGYGGNGTANRGGGGGGSRTSGNAGGTGGSGIVIIYGLIASTTPGYWTYTATSTGNVYATTTFLSNGTFNSPVSQNISVLLVGGGGGGGSQTGGGGGAGEYEYNSSFAIASSSYSVVIGSGGASNTAGNSTTFSTLIALGGGRGGEYSVNGGTGASGGGGGGGASNTTGGTGTNGYNGGNGTAVDGSNRYATGGGGGAGGVGGNGVSGTNAGVGGVGISNSISGTSIMYSCGGGGSWDTTGASGGCSSAGSGASTGGYGGNGTANRGGGGGGSRTSGNAGGTGGSGIVIIYGLIASTTPGYWTYTATSTTNGYFSYIATSTLNSYYTYVATSTTDGVYISLSSTTPIDNPYLTVGFSSTTRYNLVPATLDSMVSSRFHTSDKMLHDYLTPFIYFITTLYVSWRAYKLVFL